MFLILLVICVILLFFFSSRRRHTRFSRDWSSDVCSSDLQIPPGTFWIDRPLRVYSGDVYLKGSGSSTHIINEDKTGQPALILSADTTDLSGKDPLWRVQVSDIRISGNDNSGHGILARYINEIFITGVTV